MTRFIVFFLAGSIRLLLRHEKISDKMLANPGQPPLRKNLQRLFLLRNIVIAAQYLTFALAYWGLELELPWAEMVAVAVLLGVVNLANWIRLHRKWPVSSMEFFAQLLVDVLAL